MLSSTYRGIFRTKEVIVRVMRHASTASVPEFPEYGSHEELYRFSIDQPDEFWGKLGTNRLRWLQPFETVQKCDMSEGNFQWYLRGRLNIAGRLTLYNSLIGFSLFVTVSIDLAFRQLH